MWDTLHLNVHLKVHHRCRWHWWKMEKIFNPNFFTYYFFWTPLSSRVIKWIIFFLQVQFKMSAVWSLLPLFATGINNTSETGWKFCSRCRGAPWLANISVQYLTVHPIPLFKEALPFKTLLKLPWAWAPPWRRLRPWRWVDSASPASTASSCPGWGGSTSSSPRPPSPFPSSPTEEQLQICQNLIA